MAAAVAADLPGGGRDLQPCPAGTTSWVFDDPGAGVVLIVARPLRSPGDVGERVSAARALSASVPFVRPVGGPHRLDGLEITVWQRVPVLARRADPAAIGRAVRALHGFPPQQAALGGLILRRWDDVSDLADAVARLRDADGLRAGDGRILQRCLDRLRGELDGYPDEPTVLVHGDLHTGNVLTTADGVVLCDTDGLGIARIDWDLAFLVDPGRRARLRPDERAQFERGYGRALPPDARARTLARLAHLRRTLMLLELPRQTPRERWWNRVRLACWAQMLGDWSLDRHPAFERGRHEQAFGVAFDVVGRMVRGGHRRPSFLRRSVS